MKRVFLLLLSLPLLAYADPIDVNIDRSRERFNLGVSEFVPEDRSVDGALLDSLASVIRNDLNNSKFFNLSNSGPVVRGRTDALGWSAQGADMVLAASLRVKQTNNIEMTARLFDTKSGKEVWSASKKRTRGEQRILSHEIANEVVRYFTGQPGNFLSKIAFVNDASGRKELFVADYDGINRKRLTNDSSIVILPRVSPDGSKVVFTSYRSGNPDMYVINSDGTGRRKLSSQAGLNVSPSWAPSGDQLAVTLSINGPPNIYLIDLKGTVIRRLTDAHGADTAPCFSPDGSQIAFTSDRGGAPHIYIMNIDGSGLRRITTASHCDSASWSPDGQNILYVKGESKGRFDIYSIEVLTGIERRLTWGEGDNENPSWSPDGRTILFTSTRRGKSELYTMAIDGTEQKPLSLSKESGQSYTPHWSK